MTGQRGQYGKSRRAAHTAARRFFFSFAILLLAVAPLDANAKGGSAGHGGQSAGQHPMQNGAPPRYNGPSGGNAVYGPRVGSVGRGSEGPLQGQMRGPGYAGHLPAWFAQHSGQTIGEQEQALRREPGFDRLPAGQQQRMIDRLHKLDSAPPEVRQRMFARNEMFERLPPERQQEIRGASQALAQMPPERGQMVRRAFRDLRTLPPDQRQNALNSARFQAEYSPQERTVLGHLLSIEPYQP